MIQSSTAPTQITIHPEPKADWREAPLTRRHMADRYSGKTLDDARMAYLGDEGPGAALLDIINPLQHIPFVSALYQEVTGDTSSAVAKVVGGALLGGPFGLVAAIFDTVFEEATGKGIAGTAIAAIRGEEAPMQLADAGVSEAEILEDTAATNKKLVTDAYNAHMQEQQNAEILPPEPKQSAMASMNPTQASTVLSLYGGSASPAHKAYQSANMLNYLRDASVSATM